MARRGLRAVGANLLAIALVLAAWQLVYLSGWKPSSVLPGPATVVTNLWQQWHTPVLWHALQTTMTRAALGFSIAVVIGTALGVVVSRHRIVRVGFGPIISAVQAMPAIAWFPFAIIFFGLSTSAIVFVIVIGAAPSIANGVTAGVNHIPPLLLRASTTMGLDGVVRYRYLVLPAALPMVLAGLQQGWAFAWRSLMAGELLVVMANTPSIGVLLNNAQNLSDMPSAIAIMIVILAVGMIIDTGFAQADRAIRRRRGLAESGNG
ncbi:ABC transporter permease [Mycobacterium talmoniae]|uniref:ABC transporter permease n=1 Tax=Mycobacterium talmoniae TaxID=1858794 RepID=A0A1S1NHF9_9MYCO|nr:ABC transporter permease [Mycobacterium talmoniae]